MADPIIQVTTYPFGECGDAPRRVLDTTGWTIRYNPFGRRLKLLEARELLAEADGVIAGTEPYTAELIEQAPNLKVISRVGVGLDTVDYAACVRRGVRVTFTPEAPADAVAELTVAQMLNLLRRVHESDRSVREGAWNRYMGVLLREVKIGIVGVGRIGKRVIKLLQPFQPDLVACDLRPDEAFGREFALRWAPLADVLAECDLISLHVPLTPTNIQLIGPDQLASMKPGAGPSPQTPGRGRFGRFRGGTLHRPADRDAQCAADRSHRCQRPAQPVFDGVAGGRKLRGRAGGKGACVPGDGCRRRVG